MPPDDDTAAATRNKGPGGSADATDLSDFYPEDAVIEWAMYFDAPSAELPPIEEFYERDGPRHVAPIVNDGTGVFALDRSLITALAEASLSEPEQLAARWRERLRLEDRDDMTDESLLEILRRIARFAAIALGRGGGLYCWRF